MKLGKLYIATSLSLLAFQALANTESKRFLTTIAVSDMVGIGVFGGAGMGTTRSWIHCISNTTYWAQSTNLSSIALYSFAWSDGPLFPQDGEAGKPVVFWGTYAGWEPTATDNALVNNPSAWRIRQNLIGAGSLKLKPEANNQFEGEWIIVPSNNCATVGFVSNVVQSLCVTTNLALYSKALIPALVADVDDELFMFKASSHWEMLTLLWTESEDFLVGVMNDSDFPMQFRRLALSYLKTRFDWPEESEVPDL